MKNASMREGTSKAAWDSILRNARMSASGFLVSSAEPASARNSRERDRAKRMSVEMPQLTRMIATARRTAIKAPPPPELRRSLSDELPQEPSRLERGAQP